MRYLVLVWLAGCGGDALTECMACSDAGATDAGDGNCDALAPMQFG